MKIFVSYSRRDAGDFADQIQKHLSTFNYDVFTDTDSIRAGEIWSTAIEENISNCDLFVVIVTSGALYSPHVEREVLQAQRENKTIIPCFHKNVREDDIKWGLKQYQGLEFEDKYDLARSLQSEINKSKKKNKSNYKYKEQTRETEGGAYVMKGSKSKTHLMRLVQIVLGALAIIGSILIIANPAVTTITLIVFISILFFVVGIETIITGIFFKSKFRFVSISLGILVLILSGLALAFPVGSIVVLILVIAFALLFDGISRITHGVGEKSENRLNRFFSIGVGILSIIISILVMVSPSFGFAFLIFLIGIAILITGIQILVAGLRGKKMSFTPSINTKE